MPAKVRWGVLGVALIATRKVIPAMQKGAWSEIAGIASRDPANAKRAAAALGIPKAYGSYDEMLADPDIDAVYNPLPNHLHVPWSVAAARRGKHVLCEKPIGLSVAEAKQLIEARDQTRVKIGEAFMVRTHPQWMRAREIVRSGEIGELRSILTSFSYFNRDPANVRNRPDWGGGALFDIGCYPIHISRYLFGREPLRVSGVIERDPDFGIDRLTSGTLDFESGQSAFSVGMQLAPWQRVTILGSNGRIDVEIPFNAPPDVPTRVFVDIGQEVFGVGVRTEEFPAADQYTIQGDLFSRAIREGGEVPTPLEDSIRNMAVIEAVFRSAESGRWEPPTRI